MDSISLTTDGLSKTLYLPTPLQIPHDFLKRDASLTSTLLDRCEVFCLLLKILTDGFLDQR